MSTARERAREVLGPYIAMESDQGKRLVALIEAHGAEVESLKRERDLARRAVEGFAKEGHVTVPAEDWRVALAGVRELREALKRIGATYESQRPILPPEQRIRCRMCCRTIDDCDAKSIQGTVDPAFKCPGGIARRALASPISPAGKEP